MKFKVLQLKISRRGDALILTMFIMAGMLIAAMGGSYVALLEIRASGLEAQSTKAYYAAEAGAEDFLYQFRKQGYSDYGHFNFKPFINNNQFLFNGQLDNDTSYKVYYQESSAPVIFNSIGSYQNVKRSVQLRIGSGA